MIDLGQVPEPERTPRERALALGPAPILLGLELPAEVQAPASPRTRLLTSQETIPAALSSLSPSALMVFLPVITLSKLSLTT